MANINKSLSNDAVKATEDFFETPSSENYAKAQQAIKALEKSVDQFSEAQKKEFEEVNQFFEKKMQQFEKKIQQFENSLEQSDVSSKQVDDLIAQAKQEITLDSLKQTSIVDNRKGKSLEDRFKEIAAAVSLQEMLPSSPVGKPENSPDAKIPTADEIIRRFEALSIIAPGKNDEKMMAKIQKNTSRLLEETANDIANASKPEEAKKVCDKNLNVVEKTKSKFKKTGKGYQIHFSDNWIISGPPVDAAFEFLSKAETWISEQAKNIAGKAFDVAKQAAKDVLRQGVDAFFSLFKSKKEQKLIARPTEKTENLMLKGAHLSQKDVSALKSNQELDNNNTSESVSDYQFKPK